MIEHIVRGQWSALKPGCVTNAYERSRIVLRFSTGVDPRPDHSIPIAFAEH